MPGTIKFNYSFEDGSGNNLNDNSLYNHDATLTTDGSGVWTTDIPFDSNSKAALISPYSFTFNGEDYFEKDLSDNWSGSFSFSIWAKPTEQMDLYDSIFSTSDSHNTDYSWQLDATNTKKWNIRINLPDSGLNNFNFGDISENVWQHIAITWTYNDISANRELKLYYNGNAVKTLNATSSPSLPNDLNFLFDKYKLGTNRSNNSKFNGLLTSSKLYDSVLSESDISQIYNYNIDPSGSIHTDCSDCKVFTPTTQHVFLPVYLNNEKIVIDGSENAVTTLDASYNFIMDADYATANFFREFLKYKKVNNAYLFSFNESYKILFENALKSDIENTETTIYDSSFNSGINPQEASVGRMLVRYIADTLMGHPFAQAFIANESEIINSVNTSNLHLQLTSALVDGLSTSTFSSQEVCNSLMIQFVEDSPDRFLYEADNTVYNFPFCPGDYVSLFIKMNCTINLNEISSDAASTTNVYQMLKNIFGNKTDVIFDDSNEKMKLVEKIWRIKIKLK